MFLCSLFFSLAQQILNMKKLLRVLAIVFVVIVLLIFGYLELRPSLIVSKQKAKADLAQPTSHFFQWRGAEIHYTDEGTGIPVLMIHGFGGSFRNFQKLNDSLKNEYRCIRVDLPGFGLSDQPQVDKNTDFLALYHDFMTFFLDTLHIDSVYVVGNSMGGMMGWGMAEHDPVRVKKLVLLGAAGYELEKIAKGATGFLTSATGKLLFKKGMPLKMSEGGAIRSYAVPEKINHAEVVLNNELWNREGNIQAAFAMASSGQFPDSNLIKNIQCPTLIIWGKQDKIVPVEHAEKFHRDIKNSRVAIYDPCGHVAMIEVPELVAPEVRRFFKE